LSDKPKIAIFSGPRATIQNSAPLLTSKRERERRDTTEEAERKGVNSLRAQRLAAPITAYVEAFSAHPLERDASDLYAAPDGYIDPQTGKLYPLEGDGRVPAYEVELRPEDGLFLLPYAARQGDGSAWNGVNPAGSNGRGRQIFYPDASRIVEEIDRFGLSHDGQNGMLKSMACFDFYRAAPSGGYTKGLAESERTDRGEGDIAPEEMGKDFFCYAPTRHEPALPTLARLTNAVQTAMGSGEYAGAIWLEGSPTTEETVYWLGLLIDCEVPIIGNSSQHPHGVLGNDGDANIIESVNYIISHIWAGEDGLDRVGTVMIQNGQIFASREVQKADARPGGYVAMGGHGGIIGNTVWDPPVLSFLPLKRHTHTSTVNLTQLPMSVSGTTASAGGIRSVEVRVKDDSGQLLATALPKVTVTRYVNFGGDDFSDSAENEVEILARIEKNLQTFPLAGFVAEGSAPYGALNESLEAAMVMAVYRGMPVVTVGRGGGGFVNPTSNRKGLFIGGSNLTAPKARMLLMACLLKFGSLPLPANPCAPTSAEEQAIRERVREYQTVFNSH
jgi:L-asparaginase